MTYFSTLDCLYRAYPWFSMSFDSLPAKITAPIAHLVFAKFDPLKANYLLSKDIDFEFVSLLTNTYGTLGRYSDCKNPLNSYKFLFGGLQFIKHWKFKSPAFSTAYVKGSRHYLCFNALSPSRLDVYTKHSPFAEDEDKIMQSAGNFSPSWSSTISPQWMWSHLVCLK